MLGGIYPVTPYSLRERKGEKRGQNGMALG
jgi:hypothetical protein